MDALRASRLNLNINGTVLSRLAETDPELCGLETGNTVSLADGLFGNETELDYKGKLCLALVLSYSLLDFCGEPWFPLGWTKHGISLLQMFNQLLLRPALLTNLDQAAETTLLSSSSSDFKFLFHGILLMEIFNQAPTQQANIRNDIVLEDLRKVARDEFDSIAWGVYERFQQSVEACIEGHKGDNLDNSENSFVANFCREVIDPLEMDFVSLWGDQDPDQILSGLKLPGIKFKKPPLPPPKPGHLKVHNHLQLGFRWPGF
jgi:hypothetical protein